MENANQEGGVNIDGNVSVGKDLVGHDKIEFHLHGTDYSG
jgi:hypothetical protein